MEGERASQEEIFFHLKNLLGENALQVAHKVTDLYKSGQSDECLTALYEYDDTLGGIGVHYVTLNNSKPPGIYRALFYVYLPLTTEHATEFGRSMIFCVCGYLEELLKKIVRVWPWEKINPNGLPLGTLAKRIEKRLPTQLAIELNWLSQRVYNFAKHKYNFEDLRNEPKHYFELEDAIAVYLIVRKLGLELEEFSQKPLEYFIGGN